MKKTIKLSIDGMKCKSCAELLQDELLETKGVASAKVDFSTKKAALSFDDKSLSESDILKIIKSKGYKVN